MSRALIDSSEDEREVLILSTDIESNIKPPGKSKREDIQSLRGLSILFVLFYHYTPTWIPQGKLGVDIFFVMSGFLICTMLSRPSKDSFLLKSMQFYWRRLKRILPLAYLVFMISYVVMYIMKMKTLVPINQLFGQKALLFGANLRLSEEDEYEKQLTGATVLLTHFWSLSTEVQFYFFAPVLVLTIQSRSKKWKILQTLFLCVFSLLHYLTCSPSVAFNSPLARLWQFCAGFMAYYSMQREEDEMHKIKTAEKRCIYSLPSWLSLITIFICVFYNAQGFIEETILRLLVTVGSAWIIYAADRNPHFLNFSPLVFIGDISYSLYLVHWPVICFMKYFLPGNEFLENYGILVCLLISCVGSILCHWLFEKPFLAWSAIFNAIVIFILFILCAILTLNDFTPSDMTGDKFFDDAIKANQENIVNCRDHIVSRIASPYSLPTIPSKYMIKFPQGSGSYSFLFIGNSYAINQADMIYSYIKEVASSVILLWTPTCESLVATTTYRPCLTQFLPSVKVVEMVKPDILMVIERGFTIKEPLKSIDIMDDHVMKTMKERITKWQKWTKRIFIMGAIPQIRKTQVTKAVEYLKQKRRLIDSPSLVWYDHFPQKQRLAEVSKFCSTCHVYEWEHIFLKNNFEFQIFNATNDVLYFDDWTHLGKEGLDIIRPVYQNLLKTIREIDF